MQWLDSTVYEIFSGMPPHDKIRTMYEFLHIADSEGGDDFSLGRPAVGNVDMLVFTYFVGGKAFVLFKDVTDRYMVVFGRSQQAVSRIATQFALAGYLLLREDEYLSEMVSRLREHFMVPGGHRHRFHGAYVIVGKVEPVCTS